MAQHLRLKVIVGTVAVGLGLVAILAGPSISMEWRDRRAEALAKDGRLVEAEAEVRGLIQATPDRPRPRLLLARIAREQGRLTEAEEVLQRAVELGLDIKQARLEHALILLKEKSTSSAE